MNSLWFDQCSLELSLPCSELSTSLIPLKSSLFGIGALPYKCIGSLSSRKISFPHNSAIPLQLDFGAPMEDVMLTSVEVYLVKPGSLCQPVVIVWEAYFFSLVSSVTLINITPRSAFSQGVLCGDGNALCYPVW